MGLKNPFRRRDGGSSQHNLNDALEPVRPWWVWGPLGLVWFGGHNPGSSHDAGPSHHPGDAGHFNHTIDHGGSFGGFDGGAGGV